MPVDEASHVFEKMFMVCRILRSNMLVVQTPPSLNLDVDTIKNVSTMLSNLNTGQI